MAWPKEDWSTCLMTLLTGKALSSAMRLDGETALNYDLLKRALLKAYDLTEKGFKRKFRTARLDEGESYNLFGIRLRGYLTRWVELSGTEMRYDGLVELMLIDQLLEGSSDGFRIFLKERNPTSWEEILKLAEKYREAHSLRPNEAGRGINKFGDSQRAEPNRNASVGGTRFQGYEGRGAQHNNHSFRGRGAFGGKKDAPRGLGNSVTCFRCGQEGNLANKCKSVKKFGLLGLHRMCVEALLGIQGQL